jgi:hypothetical protein
MARTDPAERQQAEEKKSERPAEEVTVQNKCCAPCRDKKKGAARPAGCDRIKKFARQAASRSGSDRSREKKMLRDWKKVRLTDLRGQACADRPVRDRFNGSTMPVQPVLTRMVLVKKLVKSSWTEVQLIKPVEPKKY